MFYLIKESHNWDYRVLHMYLMLRVLSKTTIILRLESDRGPWVQLTWESHSDQLSAPESLPAWGMRGSLKRTRQFPSYLQTEKFHSKYFPIPWKSIWYQLDPDIFCLSIWRWLLCFKESWQTYGLVEQSGRHFETQTLSASNQAIRRKQLRNVAAHLEGVLAEV